MPMRSSGISTFGNRSTERSRSPKRTIGATRPVGIQVVQRSSSHAGNHSFVTACKALVSARSWSMLDFGMQFPRAMQLLAEPLTAKRLDLVEHLIEPDEEGFDLTAAKLPQPPIERDAEGGTGNPGRRRRGRMPIHEKSDRYRSGC